MRRLNASAVVPAMIAVIAALATTVAASCERDDRECQAQNECPLDFVCTREGTCQPFRVPDAGPRDAGDRQGDDGVDVGESEGEGEPLLDTRLDTLAPITMFVPGPTSGTAFLAQGGERTDFDQLDIFDLAQGRVTSTYRDFRNNGPACELDTLRFFSAARLPLPAGDEIWYSCAADVWVESQEAGFVQRMPMGGASAELTLLVPSNDGTGNDADARLFFARRGDTTLRIAMFNRYLDAFGTQRTVETVPERFTAIAGLYLVTVDHPTVGDLILVFDRSSPPRMVPIQRAPRAETFVAPPNLVDTNLDVLTLPPETHFAYFRENVGIKDPIAIANLTEADRDTANLVVLMPTAGRGTVRFLRYESEQLAPGLDAFIDLDLQAGDVRPADLPAPSDRILFEERPAGSDTIFTYALTRSSHVWRFPLHQSRVENRLLEVERVLFNERDAPVGVLAVPRRPDFAWVAYSNRPVLELLPFVPPF